MEVELRVETAGSALSVFTLIRSTAGEVGGEI
jgi:hypothetical protein